MRTGETDFETAYHPSEQLKASWEELKRQTQYNEGVNYSAQSFVRGSEITQSFENALTDYPTNQGLLSYIHDATDVVSASGGDAILPCIRKLYLYMKTR